MYFVVVTFLTKIWNPLQILQKSYENTTVKKTVVHIWFENFPPGMNSREKTGRIPQVHIVCLFVKFLREPNEVLEKLNERNNWQILLLIWNYFSNIYQLLKVPWSVIIWT